MNHEPLTQEDFDVVGMNIDAEKFNLLNTYYMATGDSKEEFMKNCSMSYYSGGKEFREYLINTLTARVFELERQISVNELRDEDNEDLLLGVVDKLNKIKKECVSLKATNIAEMGLLDLEKILDGYDSKLNTIIKKAKKQVELNSADIDYLVEMRKKLKKD